jgi:hypothetical protein
MCVFEAKWKWNGLNKLARQKKFFDVFVKHCSWRQKYLTRKKQHSVLLLSRNIDFASYAHKTRGKQAAPLNFIFGVPCTCITYNAKKDSMFLIIVHFSIGMKAESAFHRICQNKQTRGADRDLSIIILATLPNTITQFAVFEWTPPRTIAPTRSAPWFIRIYIY